MAEDTLIVEKTRARHCNALFCEGVKSRAMLVEFEMFKSLLTLISYTALTIYISCGTTEALMPPCLPFAGRSGRLVEGRMAMESILSYCVIPACLAPSMHTTSMYPTEAVSN